jgi:hypothetical protein
MKALLIFILTLFLFANSCSSSEKTASNNSIQLAGAAYYNWTASIPGDENSFERGTDLTLTFSNWPEKFNPEAVIFQNRRSFPAEIEQIEGTRVIIKARIVHESTVLAEVSERVNLSDRLIYTNEDGDTIYLGIDEWERMSDRYQ